MYFFDFKYPPNYGIITSEPVGWNINGFVSAISKNCRERIDADLRGFDKPVQSEMRISFFPAPSHKSWGIFAAGGNLPEALTDFVPAYLDAVPKDPFDGNDLRYKKLDTGFIVYSIGQDENDDGGKERPPKSRTTTPADVTFIVER